MLLAPDSFLLDLFLTSLAVLAFAVLQFFRRPLLAGTYQLLAVIYQLCNSCKKNCNCDCPALSKRLTTFLRGPRETVRTVVQTSNGSLALELLESDLDPEKLVESFNEKLAAEAYHSCTHFNNTIYQSHLRTMYTYSAYKHELNNELQLSMDAEKRNQRTRATRRFLRRIFSYALRVPVPRSMRLGIVLQRISVADMENKVSTSPNKRSSASSRAGPEGEAVEPEQIRRRGGGINDRGTTSTPAAVDGHAPQEPSSSAAASNKDALDVSAFLTENNELLPAKDCLRILRDAAFYKPSEYAYYDYFNSSRLAHLPSADAARTSAWRDKEGRNRCTICSGVLFQPVSLVDGTSACHFCAVIDKLTPNNLAPELLEFGKHTNFPLDAAWERHPEYQRAKSALPLFVAREESSSDRCEQGADVLSVEDKQEDHEAKVKEEERSISDKIMKLLNPPQEQELEQSVNCFSSLRIRLQLRLAELTSSTKHVEDALIELKKFPATSSDGGVPPSDRTKFWLHTYTKKAFRVRGEILLRQLIPQELPTLTTHTPESGSTNKTSFVDPKTSSTVLPLGQQKEQLERILRDFLLSDDYRDGITAFSSGVSSFSRQMKKLYTKIVAPAGKNALQVCTADPRKAKSLVTGVDDAKESPGEQGRVSVSKNLRTTGTNPTDPMIVNQTTDNHAPVLSQAVVKSHESEGSACVRRGENKIDEDGDARKSVAEDAEPGTSTGSAAIASDAVVAANHVGITSTERRAEPTGGQPNSSSAKAENTKRSAANGDDEHQQRPSYLSCTTLDNVIEHVVFPLVRDVCRKELRDNLSTRDATFLFDSAGSDKVETDTRPAKKAKIDENKENPNSPEEMDDEYNMTIDSRKTETSTMPTEELLASKTVRAEAEFFARVHADVEGFEHAFTEKNGSTTFTGKDITQQKQHLELSLRNIVPSEDDLSCPVCADLFFEPCCLPCGHVMCKSCLARHLDHALERAPICVMCRHPLVPLLVYVNSEARRDPSCAHGGQVLERMICGALECVIQDFFPEQRKQRALDVKAAENSGRTTTTRSTTTTRASGLQRNTSSSSTNLAAASTDHNDNVGPANTRPPTGAGAADTATSVVQLPGDGNSHAALDSTSMDRVDADRREDQNNTERGSTFTAVRPASPKSSALVHGAPSSSHLQNERSGGVSPRVVVDTPASPEEEEEQTWIPIFKCSIAVPGVNCGLHVFEPRYRLMMRRCMDNTDTAKRTFGMHPHSVTPFPYGCLLQIKEYEQLPDGRCRIDAVGVRRYKVLEWSEKDGYSIARVEWVDDEVEEPLSQEAAQEEETLCVSLQLKAQEALTKQESRAFLTFAEGRAKITTARDMILSQYGPVPSADKIHLVYWLFATGLLFGDDVDSSPGTLIDFAYGHETRHSPKKRLRRLCELANVTSN
ncbi:unnamed protein product [Amoebophrya sp. A120]|nr:unnamed protein product [Amoebophrya sp. A120]|eukprot:GSA120T00018424001.1